MKGYILIIVVLPLLLVSCALSSLTSQDILPGTDYFTRSLDKSLEGFYGDCWIGELSTGCVFSGLPLFLLSSENERGFSYKVVTATSDNSDVELNIRLLLVEEEGKYVVVILNHDLPEKKINMQWRYVRSYIAGGIVLGGWINNYSYKKTDPPAGILYWGFPVANEDAISVKLEGNFLTGETYSDFITISDVFPDFVFGEP